MIKSVNKEINTETLDSMIHELEDRKEMVCSGDVCYAKWHQTEICGIKMQ